MRVLVCGGRDFNDYSLLSKTMDKLCLENNWYYGGDAGGEDNWLPNVIIISGKAKGADTLALDWAAVNWCDTLEFPADWKKYGRKAGPIRNKQMLDEGKPDLVVAFPGGSGTAHMVRIAKAAGVKVIEVEYDNK